MVLTLHLLKMWRSLEWFPVRGIGLWFIPLDFMSSGIEQFKANIVCYPTLEVSRLKYQARKETLQLFKVKSCERNTGTS